MLRSGTKTAINLRQGHMLMEEAIRVRAGFPMRSLVGALFNYVPPPPENRTTNVYHWITRPPSPLVSKKIEPPRPMWPLAPIWPGFAINTLFYAAILWLMFAAPFALRRRKRIKRGLCPACAYPVGTSDVCTECGAAVPLSHREHRKA